MTEEKKSRPKPAKTSGAGAKKEAGTSVYVAILKQQIASDIQAAKTGSLDEELIRERLTDDPMGPLATLNLWLLALCTGVIDNLDVVVTDKEGEPDFLCVPMFESRVNPNAPVLGISLPGPVSREDPDEDHHEPPQLESQTA